MHDNHQAIKDEYVENLEFLSKSRFNSKLQKVRRQVLFKITLFALTLTVITLQQGYLYTRSFQTTVFYIYGWEKLQ